MSLTIGVDIGGTKIAAGVVDEGGTIVRRTRRDTPSSHPEAIEDAIAAVVEELCDGGGDDAADGAGGGAVEAVGIGAAGFIDADRSTVLFAPNLAWRNERLRDEVSKRVQLPVVVENDANAAAWAEAKFGAGHGAGDLVAITVGTGIGGGIVLGGRLYRGRHGIAAEMGHVEVVRGGRRCGCGKSGCWEQYASGRALLTEAREIAHVQPARAKRLLDLGDGDPDGFSGPDVTTAAREGDEAALEAYAVVGSWLGHGLAGLALVLDPALIVIGGGVSEAGDLLLDPTRAAYEGRMPARDYRPLAEIRLASLGNDAGLVGAADLARQRD